MKAVKIILAIAVVGIISFSIYNWDVIIEKIIDANHPKNLYIEKIEKEIASLKNAPTNVFCHDDYKKIQDGIDEFYKNGSLGITPYKDGNIWKDKKDGNNNNEWKKILSKNLYSAYAPKFVEQAMYVFSRSEWKNDDLKFIRSEVKSLEKSSYLTPGPVTISFNTINTILAKYDEINAFIYNCKGYSYSNYDMGITYPDLSNKIQKTRTYRANNLDNTYVNNCTRLKTGLQAIPKILFDKHISYLTKKINDNGARFSDFIYQSDYSNTIYTPLRNQVAALNNDIYGISDNAIGNGYNSVYNLLSGYNRDATNYYKSLNKKN
jgi:hypothetical protein